MNWGLKTYIIAKTRDFLNTKESKKNYISNQRSFKEKNSDIRLLSHLYYMQSDTPLNKQPEHFLSDKTSAY